MYRRPINALVLCLLAGLALLAPAQAQPLPAAEQKSPLTILSIIPAQGEPGTVVTVNGTGFTPSTTAALGTRELPTFVPAGGRLLSFELPDLPAGAYALYLKREDGTTSRAFNFMVQPQKPVATTLSPDTVVACATGRDREVVVSGAHFQTGSQLLFDGAAIGSRLISSSALAFQAPPLPGGMHQVQVRNPSGAVSGSLALFIDGKPQILTVSVGNDHVSYYDLIISGRNFLQTSMLVADGTRVGTAQPAVGDRDQLLFMGCSEIVYQRHPYDQTPREIRLQVVNPNGDESGIFTISAP